MGNYFKHSPPFILNYADYNRMVMMMMVMMVVMMMIMMMMIVMMVMTMMTMMMRYCIDTATFLSDCFHFDPRNRSRSMLPEGA